MPYATYYAWPIQWRFSHLFTLNTCRLAASVPLLCVRVRRR
ncbi:hypothetical protein SAMN05421831_1088 [Allopseudospirillum japonicum]|uniref:Uncharacterized protein n=1 Tax=Allopseudospirillum japonicum TaxID=64971 RepID=A0A1H6STU9_9GAMM|nr:hypothetical protein SAMN05421831_1088 [Allopseudospirillum japonicum]